MAAPAGSLDTWDAGTIVARTFPLLIVLSLVVLIAGITLEDAEQLLSDYGLLAVMVPTMLAMGGNLGAIMSARLSTRLHLGTAELDPRDRTLWANVAAILALAVTVFTALAVGAYLFGLVLGVPIGLGALLLIALGSGIPLAIIAIVLSLVTTYASYRLGIDPDDTTIPIVTNVVDVFGMLVFVGVSGLVLP